MRQALRDTRKLLLRELIDIMLLCMPFLEPRICGEKTNTLSILMYDQQCHCNTLCMLCNKQYDNKNKYVFFMYIGGLGPM